ncbi:11655_t:CDS:2 [Acaulospora morrowiae]|uniref:11655_t:CDS:1 n=1 Tax=Acaulospora morrowiae TaxID=94023 RepID=A0A9N8WCB8_9GLOM|nr:11655_t:CDS:2 [Acaulospora morrowiae]
MSPSPPTSLSSDITRTAPMATNAKVSVPTVMQGNPNMPSLTELGQDTYYRYRTHWIAFWVLWLIWALLTLWNWFRHELTRSENDDGTRTAAGEISSTTERAERNTNNLMSRFDHGSRRAQRISRDLLLGLLSALTVNTLGQGSGTAVEVLAWIYLGLAIIWLSAEMRTSNKIMRSAMGFLLFAILLTIFILAYARGW